MELAIILTSMLVVAVGDCPGDWEEFDDSCYHVSGTRTSFDAAMRRCAAYQSHLLSVRHERENSFVEGLIASFLDNQFWIGIHFNQTSGYWLDDGTEVTWSRWVGPKLPCALMTGTQRWTTEKCSYFHQYICKYEIKPTTEGYSTKHQSSKTSNAVRHMLPNARDTTLTSRTGTTSSSSHGFSTTTATTSTTTVVLTTTAADDLSDEDIEIPPEGVVIDRKKNPGRTHTDNRPSAIGIGSMGVGVLIVVFLGVFFLDASKLWRDFAMFRHNIAELFRTAKRPKLRKKREQICTSF